MKHKLVVAAVAMLLLPAAAQAQERVGDAALGALSGAVVLGPVGAVAGALVGFTAGPHIAGAWGVRTHAEHPVRAPQIRQAQPGLPQRIPPRLRRRVSRPNRHSLRRSEFCGRCRTEHRADKLGADGGSFAGWNPYLSAGARVRVVAEPGRTSLRQRPGRSDPRRRGHLSAHRN